MIARRLPVALSQCQNQTRPLLPTTATIVISAALALWAAAPNDKSLAADNPEKPNVVLVFADDKYEHSQPKVDNTLKKRLKSPFRQEFQITWNCGKLGQITGN